MREPECFKRSAAALIAGIAFFTCELRADSQAASAVAAEQITPQDLERKQALWWYLLFGGVLLLATETILSNRISKV